MMRLATVALIFVATMAIAAPRRVAVVVGNDLGAPEDPQLRYARKDATRIAQVLRELGGVRGEDLHLLLDSDAETVRSALTEASQVQDGVEPAVLLFYYSGHADENALHLGPTKLSWADVRDFVERDSAPLRLAIVDACRAGALTTPKGFALTAPFSPPERVPRGSAVMVAADSDVAQEDAALGGGVFTHFLIAALRGAADADHDRRVTLAEAQSYATARTREATAARATSVQRPAYHIDVAGQDEVVLTDLRDASTRVSVSEQLSGQLVISDRESHVIVVDTDKRKGERLELGLPSGRYRAHLRREKALWVGDLDLPWGGHQELDENDLVPRSYQEVAQRGGEIEVHRHRLRLAGSVGSEIVNGMGPVLIGHVGYGLQLGSFELGARFGMTHQVYSAVDSLVHTTMGALAVTLAFERAWRMIDLRVWVLGEGQVWHQEIGVLALDNTSIIMMPRNSFLFGVGLGAGLRVPFWSRFFGEASVEGIGSIANVQGSGVNLRPTGTFSLALGVRF